MVCEGFSRRRFDLSEEGRRSELLSVRIEEIRGQLPGQSLRILAILDQRSRLAQSQKDLVLAYSLRTVSSPSSTAYTQAGGSP